MMLMDLVVVDPLSWPLFCTALTVNCAQTADTEIQAHFTRRNHASSPFVTAMCSRRAHVASVPSLDPVQTFKALIHQPAAAAAAATAAQFNPRSRGAAGMCHRQRGGQ